MSTTCEIQQEVAFEIFEASEVYAHSLSTLKKLGSVAIGEISDPEQQVAIDQLAFDDFSTAIAEMLKTDEEFGAELEVNNNRAHAVIDGMVRASDGTAMVEVLSNGLQSSAKLRESDPRFEGQMVRDACDVTVAKKVDELEQGQTLWGVSFAPQKDLEDYPEIYNKKFGYKRELIYVQTYSMGDDELITGSYSFEVTDKDAFRELLAERGMYIPEDESDNTWLLHNIVADLSSEEARDFIQELRHEYYKRIGKNATKQSVSQYMESSYKTLRHFFDAYYPDLGKAVKTNTNNDTLRSFAKSLLEGGADLKPEIVQQLLRIRNSQKFTAEDGSMTDSIIRYAVAEEMRKGLQKTQIVSVIGKDTEIIMIQPHVVPTAVHASNVNALFAQNIREGIVAKRSYGGCPGNIELGKKNDGLNQDGPAMNGLQEAYGGKGTEENREVSDSKEGKIRCFKCREIVNKREVVKEKTWCCPKCKYEVDICTGDVKNQGEKPQETDDSSQEKDEYVFARILSEAA